MRIDRHEWGRLLSQDESNQRSRRSRRQQPLRIELSLAVNVGDEPEDRVTILNEREIPMVDSVFRYRDRITRFGIGMVWRVVARSPAAYREIVPSLFRFVTNLRPGGER